MEWSHLGDVEDAERMESDSPILQWPSTINCARVRLRTLQAADASVWSEALLEGIPTFPAWMSWRKPAPTVEWCADEIARLGRAQQPPDLQIIYLIEPLEREDDECACIGTCGLVRMDLSVPRFEIGYYCRPAMQGRGYLTEAVGALANMAFDVLGARRVEILCDARNLRSIRIPERLGFRLEGRFVHDRRDSEGGLADTIVYARTR